MYESEEKSLGELVKFVKGRKVATSGDDAEGTVPYLGASAICGGHDGYALPSGGVLATNRDVLMLWDGERSGLVGKDLEGIVSSTVAKLTPKTIFPIEPNGVTTEFLYYLLSHHFDWIQARRTGTGVPHVPKDLGRILRLSYPQRYDDQVRITEILGTVDRGIRETEALIAKHQMIKAGMMHDLFTRGVKPNGELRPHPTQAPDLYKSSGLGHIPKEWVIQPLESVLESIVDGPFGSNLKSEHYSSEGVRVVRLQNISAGNYNDGQPAFISERHAASLARNRVIGGDVLVAGLGEDQNVVGRACLYPHQLPPAVNKADCFRLRFGPSTSNAYGALFLNSIWAQIQVRSLEQGVTRRRVNTTNMKRIVVFVPRREEQEQTVSAMDTVCSTQELLEEEAMKQRALKKGLIARLLGPSTLSEGC